MKENNITELVFILDRSGSMFGLESDTIGGFNAMIAKQKREDGKAYVSTILFDNESSVLHDRMPLSEIPKMTSKDYHVRGCTALVDAIGANIDAIETAASFGIARNRAVNYHADSEGTQVLYETISAPISAMRSNQQISDNWSTQIEENFRKRK